MKKLRWVKGACGSDGHVSITVRGYSGVGWELQCSGPRRWVKRTLERFIPECQMASLPPPEGLP